MFVFMPNHTAYAIVRRRFALLVSNQFIHVLPPSIRAKEEDDDKNRCGPSAFPRAFEAGELNTTL